QAASIPTETDENPPVAKPRTRAVTAQSPPRFTLLIRATQTSSVSITADGEPVAKETLIAPAQTSVRATHEIVVRAGNSAGVSFLLNNREIPVGGAPGEIRTYTFDSSGLRDSDSSPSSSASR
ncbi:MAG: RodZ domain-containing protein, partial [Candidatus Sulfotelmatobacter sp.]